MVLFIIEPADMAAAAVAAVSVAVASVVAPAALAVSRLPWAGVEGSKPWLGRSWLLQLQPLRTFI